MWKKLGVAVLPVLAVTAVILGEDVEHKSGRMFIGSVVDGMAVVPIGDLPERGSLRSHYSKCLLREVLEPPVDPAAFSLIVPLSWQTQLALPARVINCMGPS
jgi:hypothetical protein